MSAATAGSARAMWIPRPVPALLPWPAARRALVRLAGGGGRRPVSWPLPCGARVLLTAPEEWIQSRLLAEGRFEPHVDRLLGRLVAAGDLLLDVGANIGYHSLAAAVRGARVEAFEPVPRLADHLARHVALNHLEGRIEIHRLALAADDGTAPFHVNRRKDDGSHSLLATVPARETETIRVPTARLDALLAAILERHPDLERPPVAKVDVEGCEALVLDGALDTLASARPPDWVLETGDRLAGDLGESAASVLGRLADRDYRLFRLPLVTPDDRPDEPPRLVPVAPDAVSGELADYLAVHRSSPRCALAEALAAGPGKRR